VRREPVKVVQQTRYRIDAQQLRNRSQFICGARRMERNRIRHSGLCREVFRAILHELPRRVLARQRRKKRLLRHAQQRVFRAVFDLGIFIPRKKYKQLRAVGGFKVQRPRADCQLVLDFSAA
jgi:hypothetical protein